jgi:hypothetical protein
MSDLEVAEHVVADLEAKRAAAIRRGTDLADERASVALRAHTGDKQARTKLDQINAALAVHASELASLDAAIGVANAKVGEARVAASKAADRAAAQRLRAVTKEFVDLGHELDGALSDLADIADAMMVKLGHVHRHGSPVPSHEQLDSLGYRCLLTALSKTRWARRFERLAPSERRNFADLVDGWAKLIEANIARREQTNTEAA